MGELWGQYVPSWIAAVSSFTAVFAVLFAWRSLRSEDTRQRRRDAEMLGAWWAVHKHEGEENRWGVVVNNPTNVTFRNVSISATGGKHAGDHSSSPIRALPPGRCFVVANPEHEKFAWTITPMMPTGEYQPVLYSNRHVVTSIRFTDAAAVDWIWTPEAGLAEA